MTFSFAYAAGLSKGYLLLINFWVSLAIFVTVITLFLHMYLLDYLSKPLEWKLLPDLYSTIHKFTRLPIIVGLLREGTDPNDLNMTTKCLMWIQRQVECPSWPQVASSKIHIYWNMTNKLDVQTEITYSHIFTHYLIWQLHSVKEIIGDLLSAAKVAELVIQKPMGKVSLT